MEGGRVTKDNAEDVGKGLRKGLGHDGHQIRFCLDIIHFRMGAASATMQAGSA